MKLAFSTGRPAHVALPASLLVQRGVDVTIYSAAYRSRFRGLNPAVHLRWAPQFVASLHFVTGIQLPRAVQRIDTCLYDRLVAARMESFDLFWGWATGALSSGRAARMRGARFILDRACPHVDAQQALVETESHRLGIRYDPEPAWFRDRQLAEYEEADTILVPSNYSAASFPDRLRARVVIAPLFGRVPSAQLPAEPGPLRQDGPFTFGTVGGQPLRKGFLYLLQAWERLRLPNARLLLRTDAKLEHFPALRDLLLRLPNVEIVGYLDSMSEFYRRCDAFVFPTTDDGFGMALLEAMVHGLPSIATDHCGAAEMFLADQEKNPALLVVPAQNSESLGAAMESIYRSPELRQRLGANGRQAVRRVEDNGSHSLYAAALDQILRHKI